MTTGRRAAASPWAARGGRGRVRVVPPRPRGAEDPAAQPELLPAGGSAWPSAEFVHKQCSQASCAGAGGGVADRRLPRAVATFVPVSLQPERLCPGQGTLFRWLVSGPWVCAVLFWNFPCQYLPYSAASPASCPF